jgi:hypothetical protein
VNLYYGAKGNSRFIGKRVYPVLGKGQTVEGQLNTQTSTLNMVDDRLPFNTSPAGLWSPLGGTTGADLTATSAYGSMTVPTVSETSAPLPAPPTAGTP